ncbi:sperm flagellar protein 1 [Lepisosteus oculatus]|uniref:Sperm flagellar protein 1 n=1 Tax=Lepisosteus oculatus TaxID=7918 RepID=W5M079_LEPOC|nr:PREDICTED: sperm flagellar protein 1 [Lepisosteus oculatus]
MSGDLDEDSLQELYAWVDRAPLSRPKRNITRDFSDGVLTAEIVKFHFPKLVEMHNYVPASSTQQKVNNWSHLNRKVFNRLNFSVPEELVRKVAQCTPGMVELVLHSLRQKIEEKQKQGASKPSPQEPQYYSMESSTAGQLSPHSPRLKLSGDGSPAQQRAGRVPAGCAQPAAGPDPATRLLLEEREQALLSAQETIQLLQAKVHRLHHLLHLKDIRIDELSRRLQHPQKTQ